MLNEWTSSKNQVMPKLKRGKEKNLEEVLDYRPFLVWKLSSRHIILSYMLDAYTALMAEKPYSTQPQNIDKLNHPEPQNWFNPTSIAPLLLTSNSDHSKLSARRILLPYSDPTYVVF